MPMALLADYLDDLAILLGEDKSVHLIGIEDGSHTSVMRIEREAEPKVRAQLKEVERENAALPIMDAYARLNARLRRDNATGTFVGPKGADILFFPGNEPTTDLEYGPVTQAGTLDGIPMLIGGTKDTVSVHLLGRDGERRPCSASTEKALEIAPYMFKMVIRVRGLGKWLRQPEGGWEMRSFTIDGFEPLAKVTDISLRKSIEDMRAIPAKWKDIEDPVAELERIRYDTET
jgi:hypothetical protein